MKAHSCQTQAQLERLGQYGLDPDHLLQSLERLRSCRWCPLSNLSEDPEDMCVLGFLSGNAVFGFKSGEWQQKSFTFWESCSLLISFSLASSISLFSLPSSSLSIFWTWYISAWYCQFPTLAFLLFPTKMSFALAFSKFFSFPSCKKSNFKMGFIVVFSNKKTTLILIYKPVSANLCMLSTL